MKKQFDRSSHVVEYKVDDWVYVWKPAPKGCDFRKFYDHYRGPFKIVSKVTEYTYKIELGPNKFDIVHMEKLKLAKNPSSKPPIVQHSATQDSPIENENSQPCFRDLSSHIDGDSRPIRDRNPVRRLTYGQDFAQTEQ